MKRTVLLSFFLILVLCLVFMWLFLSPARVKSMIISYMGKQLSPCQVKIDKVNFKPFSYIEIYGVAIEGEDNLPLIYIDRIKISYSLFSLFMGDIEEIILKSPKVNLRQTKSGDWNISRIRYERTGRRGIGVTPRKIFIQDCQFEGDVTMKGSLNGLLELEKSRRTKSINVKGRLEFKDIGVWWHLLELTSINGMIPFAFEFKTGEEKSQIANVTAGDGIVNIGTLRLDKFSIHDLWVNMIARDGGFGIERLSFEAYNGNGRGSAILRIEKGGLEYNLSTEINKIELSSLTNSYYPDRLFMTGETHGTIKINGKGDRLDNFEGDFFSIEPGGKIEVRSTKELLAAVPDSPDRDSLKLALESMRNYTYNNGSMKIRSDGKNTMLVFSFSGPEGKRDIEIGLH